MTKRERIIHAFEHKDTDIIPFAAGFTHQALDNMVRHTGNPDFLSTLDPHLRSVYYDGWPTEIPGRKNFFEDAYGVIWDRSGADKDIGVCENILVKDFDNIDYVLPPVDEVRIRKEYEALMENKGECFAYGGIGFSLFERCWTLAGMTEVLMAMVLNPEGLHKLCDMVCDYHCQIIDIALEYDLDGFYFGDDWGQQRGLIMGEKHWREFLKPRLKRMYKKVKDKGLFVIQHSCGDIETIFEDLIEIGLDCYQTFQPEIYDIKKVKETYGDRLSFWGGISTQQLLATATPEEVKRVTIETMKTMYHNGGYIAAPTHALEFDVPPENILAMFEVFQNQDKYL